MLNIGFINKYISSGIRRELFSITVVSDQSLSLKYRSIPPLINCFSQLNVDEMGCFL